MDPSTKIVAELTAKGFMIESTVENEPRDIGEKSLWTAVLSRTLLDIRGTKDRCGKKNREAAIKWIFSKDRSIYSFLWACDILGLPPKDIRRFVRAKLLCKV